jgi:hypothetical protein
MMVGRMIMTLVEPTESWNPRSLMMGMMGMGGMGMGMGGMGMGGMGMGGMGGGFRSVPPTDLPDATIQPGQTRRLSTRVVSLNMPSPETGVVLPQAGEKLLIGDIAQLSSDPKIQKALRRLARDKAPETVSQLVLWNLAGKIEWSTIAQVTRGWVNAQELALARQLVEQLDTLPDGDGESGQIFIEVVAIETSHEKLASDLNKVLDSKTILGLKVASGVPEKPSGPSIGCKIHLVGQPDQPEVLVKVAESNGHREWTSMGKFSLFVPLDKDGQRDLVALGDKVAEGVLDRLVRAKLIKGRKPIEGTMTYTLQVDNASPLILNGFAVVGGQAKPSDPPHFLLGIGLPPQRSMQMSLTPGMVESFGMKKGARLVALDLSAL